MEMLSIAVQIALLLIIISVPVILVVYGHRFVKVNLISMPLLAVLVIFSAYWQHLYADLRLEFMGFDFNGLSDEKRTISVAPELKQEAINLYWSNMGVGWPLKAILWMAIFAPYPSLVCGSAAFIKYIKRKFGSEIT